MGVPFVLALADPFEQGHAFVRFEGPLPAVGGDYVVVACTHDDIDGSQVTEALLSGPGAYEQAIATFRDIQQVARVRSPEWFEQAIAVASGARAPDPGRLAVSALRTPLEELTMLSHPRAPSGEAILNSFARVFASLGVQV